MPNNNSVIQGTYYVLDMGNTQYGDCIVGTFGDLKVLIDGGHRQDLDGQAGCRSIPEQLDAMLGKGPHSFDLLVVTHCHDDHIGCLPELVEQGIVAAKWALVSDPTWGYGGDEESGADSVAYGLDGADPDVRGLVAALTEEDHSDLANGPLQLFIDAVAKTEDRYNAMLKTLAAAGTHVVRYQRDPIPAALVNLMKPTAWEVLGPSKAQLEACSAQLAAFAAKAARSIRNRKSADADFSAVDVYRDLQGSGGVDGQDMAGTSGPAKNNQSIVMAFGPPGGRVLLGADMQLAQPELDSADAEIEKLRETVKAAGPYAMVKALHHTSYNGIDDTTLTEWGPPQYVLHSGGRRDSHHPDKGALATLKASKAQVTYARTDRNGLLQFCAADKVPLTYEKGRIDDYTVNSTSDGTETANSQPEDLASVAARTPAKNGTTHDGFLIIRVPGAGARVSVDGVNIELEPLLTRSSSGQRRPYSAPGGNRSAGIGDTGRAAAAPVPRVPAPSVGVGRRLDNLLFITNREGLAKNIGIAEAQACADAITQTGSPLIDFPAGTDRAAFVRSTLAKYPDVKGVVIIGGYDIVPAVRLDVLSADLRTRLGDKTAMDGDNFIVWSDDVYGDRSGGSVADLPVSRIPDARDSALVMNALAASAVSNGERFGIRNVNREFADSIWTLIPGSSALMASGPEAAVGVKSGALAQQFVYFMLHGRSSDGRVFLGEQSYSAGDGIRADAVPAALADASFIDALYAEQVPAHLGAVVFAGCCWGALTVKDLASNSPSSGPTPRVPEASIALSCLKAGALAFVGCTGSHYSPDASGGFAGGPMHRHFWTNVTSKAMSPAAALYQAKKDYLGEFPHGRQDLFEIAIERKILQEFTCLGLGW
jgi:beta-lactamase superfamily II metal-dependent hydrolase